MHITTDDLIDLGFSRSQVLPELGVTRWVGHRLSVEHSPKHIRIKMQGCGCPLISGPVFIRDQMVALLFALNPAPAQ
jgi:hypothetical protein